MQDCRLFAASVLISSNEAGVQSEEMLVTGGIDLKESIMTPTAEVFDGESWEMKTDMNLTSLSKWKSCRDLF